AVKLDIYNNDAEGTDSTGIFSAGNSPTIRDPALPATPTPLIPDQSVDMTSAGINLTGGGRFRATLVYDGTTLTEIVTDESLGINPFFTTAYAVNIPALVGGDAAYVGFGGGTGGLSTVATVQSWKFAPTTQSLPPSPPSNLQIASVTPRDAHHNAIAITWTTNAYNETGYEVWRSADGTHFSKVATLPPNSMSFTDPRVPAGTYSYEVRAFNRHGASAFSNVASVITGTPSAPATVDHSAGFSSSGDLTTNGSATFASVAGTRVAELTDGGGGEAASVFTHSRIGVGSFTTTFTFRMHDGTGFSADGMAFVLQGDGPAALGGVGGGLGYGADTPGGPQGIPRSVAIKFDLYNNAGEGTDSTGIFFDGDSPTIPTATGAPADATVDMSGSGIDLHSQDVFQVTLTYNGTTLTEVLLDTNTGVTFRHAYTVNIAAYVGSLGYVGFTGGTGGLTTVADVKT
ncbi:MAG TPA: hypothetical protein VKJ07_24195, partial [Mycobacteriales bacterium]|nr:hypothetical protein [Mycobacteriales bacterium]